MCFDPFVGKVFKIEARLRSMFQVVEDEGCKDVHFWFAFREQRARELEDLARIGEEIGSCA